MENNEIKYSEEIEKVVNQKKTDCALYGTEECRFLNMGSCGECPVGDMKREKQEKAGKALGRLRAAADPADIEPLYTGEKCLFCRDGEGSADCFALFDLRKEDPEGNWTVALGKKKLDIKGADMILPLQVSCCHKCRSKYRTFAYLPTLTALLIAALGLLLTTATPIYKKLFAVGAWMPFVTMLLFGAAAFAVYFILKFALARSLKKSSRADVTELPGLKTVLENGFTEVYPKKYGVSQLVFVNERRETGVYSRADAPSGGEEAADAEGDEGEEKPLPPLTDEGELPQVCGIMPCEIPPEEAQEKDKEVTD